MKPYSIRNKTADTRSICVFNRIRIRTKIRITKSRLIRFKSVGYISQNVHKIADISVEADVLECNRKIGEDNLNRLRSKGITSVDFMGAIGSGKTLLITKLATIMKEKGMRPAVIAGDLVGQDDYNRFTAAGIPSLNLNTGKECHLDAHMVDHALDDLDLDSIDYLFIENVGNLVCPADFPLGTDRRVVIISVTEGDDMIRKQPMIFSSSDITILNKMDIAQYMDIDIELLDRDYATVTGGKKLIKTSAKTEEGFDELLAAIGVKL